MRDITPTIRDCAAMQSETDDMRDRMAVKIRENRARRKLRQQGRMLIKSRARNPDFGGYVIVNVSNNIIEAGELGSPQALSLDDVEEWIRS